MHASINTMTRSLAALLLAAAISQTALAGSVTLPNSFTAGTPAVAAEVNANFDAVKTAVDDNDSRVAALEAMVTALQNRIAALENNNVQALNDNVALITDDYGYLTVRFTGVNVQIINGVDQTTANGLGNLIIGYNEARPLGSLVCSDGQYADQASCEAAGETWALNHKTGSHNLVGGNENSYSSTGGMVLGKGSAINREFAVVSGGEFNIASGLASSVSGGRLNIASGAFSSISGGSDNKASGYGSNVSGGDSHKASGYGSSVSGGITNTASGSFSSVSGGRHNTASGLDSSISGGDWNFATGAWSSVSGGQHNTASGNYGSVSGGSNRSATGDSNWAAGSLYENQ